MARSFPPACRRLRSASLKQAVRRRRGVPLMGVDGGFCGARSSGSEGQQCDATDANRDGKTIQESWCGNLHMLCVVMNLERLGMVRMCHRAVVHVHDDLPAAQTSITSAKQARAAHKVPQHQIRFLY